MNTQSKITFKTILAISDVISLVASFTVSYILRVKFSDRPTFLEIGSFDFIAGSAILIPIWIIILYSLGLYRDDIIQKTKELPRLFVGSLLGVSLMISFAYFTDDPIFPAKLVALYALFFSFAIMTVFRAIVYRIKLTFLKSNIGNQKIIIIGNDAFTTSLINTISSDKSLGYEIVGIIARPSLIPKNFRHLKFRSLDSALKLCNPDAIIQTDTDNQLELYEAAVNHHLYYYFIPSHQALADTKHSSELIGSIPVISVKTTPLMGYGQVVKRIMDVIFSAAIILLSSPLWLVVIITMKISEPTAPIFFKQKRLSRFNKVVNIYKFRSMKQEFCGLLPEEAFAKIGKPELAKEYRANGDQIENDPRVTTIGKFLRKTSLDELPQLLNVLKGDISLVGPRALVPEEINQYRYRNLILTVKSGLTGLAQVSGRRDISFEERRALDIYYVHNWSIMLDLQIIVKTALHVLLKKGAS